MADLLIRNVDEETMTNLRRTAEHSGTSVEELVRSMIDNQNQKDEHASIETAKTKLEIVREMRARFADRSHTPSEILKHEIYDERLDSE